MKKIGEITSQEFDYYVRKIRRRLFRRLIEYEVLVQSLERDGMCVAPQILETMGLTDAELGEVHIKDHVEKGCITGLKTEFELFLTIYCAFVVDHILQKIERCGQIPEKHRGILKDLIHYKKFFRDFLSSGLGEARRHIIEQVVPSKGLESLEKLLRTLGWTDVLELLNAGTGRDLGLEFQEVITNPWHQIQVAFQVRHAIEHTFSKVGEGFLQHTRCSFPETTWGRWWSVPERQIALARDMGFTDRPRIGDRVMLDRVDVLGTGASMSWTVSVIARHWSQLAVH